MGNLFTMCLERESLPSFKFNFACCSSKIIDETDGTDINNDECSENEKDGSSF